MKNEQDTTSRMITNGLANSWSNAGLKATAEEDGSIWTVTFGNGSDLRYANVEVHSRKDCRFIDGTGVEVHFRIEAGSSGQEMVQLEVESVEAFGCDAASLLEAAKNFKRLEAGVNSGAVRHGA